MMLYIIRQATPLDFAAINRLCVEAYREFETVVGAANWKLMQDVLAQASDLSKAGELIVAEDSTGLLGVVLYVPPGRSDGISIPSEWASIRMLAVSGLSRGRGLGRKLTQECIDRAGRDEAEAIGLTTSEMMKIALAIYEKMGFEREAELEPRFAVKHTRYVLRLKGSIVK